MIELKNDQLVFSFPQVHAQAQGRVGFQRTLRIPDDNQEYPLPPGFGEFPLQHVDDFEASVPAHWKPRGGVFLPMYQSEAMWLCFSGLYPMAIKVAAGKINAVTGEEWTDGLEKDPQDYMVTPDQPWLDGFSVDKGMIRQFVAMPLGQGYSAEEQLTGSAEHGGLQIIAYPMKAEYYDRIQKRRTREFGDMVMCSVDCVSEAGLEMGLAPGGLMRQEIYDDRHGFDAWDAQHASRCFVHITNSLGYLDITGHAPPTRPPSAEQYTRAGLPWFEYFDAEQEALKGSKKLAGLDSVSAMHVKKGKGVMPGNKAIKPGNIKHLGSGAGTVREGDF